jgi:Flp pilus assembly protein TadG
MIRTRARAQAIVEFAFVLPVFLLLVFTMIEGARFMMTFALVTDASREGARAATLPSAANVTTVKNTALGRAGGFVPGLTASNISVKQNGTTVTGSFTNRQADDEMSVTVTYTFTFLIRGFSDNTSFPLSTFVMNSTTTMRSEG